MEPHARQDGVAVRAGATVATSPAALVATSDKVITILTNASAMQAVRGKFFVDMSTVRGADHRGLAPSVAAKGALFLECPVSGTVQPAREGKLFGFAGGQREAQRSSSSG